MSNTWKVERNFICNCMTNTWKSWNSLFIIQTHTLLIHTSNHHQLCSDGADVFIDQPWRNRGNSTRPSLHTRNLRFMAEVFLAQTESDGGTAIKSFTARRPETSNCDVHNWESMIFTFSGWWMAFLSAFGGAAVLSQVKYRTSDRALAAVDYVCFCRLFPLEWDT